mmetsp:Transcript_40847/g.123677  ORF Transcript_40847/g.123677 Transcript_40847/m.123677 type:complete len:473 (+) Transcript_40847:1127-2545(+)
MPSRAAARIQAEKRATQARIAFAERQQQAAGEAARRAAEQAVAAQARSERRHARQATSAARAIQKWTRAASGRRRVISMRRAALEAKHGLRQRIVRQVARREAAVAVQRLARGRAGRRDAADRRAVRADARRTETDAIRSATLSTLTAASGAGEGQSAHAHDGAPRQGCGTAALLMLQAHARRRLVAQRLSAERRAALGEREARAAGREARRVARAVAVAAVRIQAAQRRRSATAAFAPRREARVEKRRAMAAIRVAAAAFLRSSGAIEEKEARRIRNAAAALLQAAWRGRRDRVFASRLLALPTDPRVVVHSVSLVAGVLAPLGQLWFVLELGSLLRVTSKVRSPRRRTAPSSADGSAQVRFEEIFQVRLVDVETRSFRTAERLRELICDSGRDEASVETDLVLTLFGKHEERPVQALGEAYINLREMAASGVDFAPPRVLEILNSRDEAVGHFSISVTAVVAFTALHYFV